MSKELIFFIIALKNALVTRKPSIITSKSADIFFFIKRFYREGLILSYSTFNNSYKIYFSHSQLSLLSFKSLKILSSPGFSRYIKYEDLCKLTRCHAPKKLILTTNKGVITNAISVKNKIGGKLYYAM
jgi:ribosomal protein S8